MKKGIEIWSDYDKTGRWHLNIKKEKGKFNLAELREILREWEWDFYLILVDAYTDEEPQFAEMPKGDFVKVYRTDLFMEEE